MKIHPLVLVASLLLALPVSAQDISVPMTLNRSGQWAEAARAAEALLLDTRLTLSQQCQVRYSLAYAYDKTSRAEQARREANRVLGDCAALSPDNAWVLREAESIARPAAPIVRADDGWRTGNPAELGLNLTALREHEHLCTESGADGCLVAVRGQIVQEWYGPQYRDPMFSMSSVKSWTALLAGLLIEQGAMRLDDSVSKWIPEWQAGADGGVTVRHLLSMTSGLNNRTAGGVGSVADKNALAFSLPLDTRPGSSWSYSNEGVQLLSPILERAAGQPLEDFARERLFEPLRMRDTRLNIDQAGSPWTYGDAYTTLRDMAKICQLALQRGMWDGRQIVPTHWIDTVTTPLALRPDPKYGVELYGMLWWLNSNPRALMTKGYRDTDCYAFPEYGVVVARMQSGENAQATRPYTFATVANIARRLGGG